LEAGTGADGGVALSIVRTDRTLMTESSAEKVANVLIGTAAIGIAYYVLKTPPLRRAAWRLAVAALTGTIPAWVTHEIRNGWEASAYRAEA
jgi:hypothetical protein